MDKPRYRLRYWPIGGRQQWQVSLTGAKDHNSASTSWRRTAEAALADAAVMQRYRETKWC